MSSSPSRTAHVAIPRSDPTIRVFGFLPLHLKWAGEAAPGRGPQSPRGGGRRRPTVAANVRRRRGPVRRALLAGSQQRLGAASCSGGRVAAEVAASPRTIWLTPSSRGLTSPCSLRKAMTRDPCSRLRKSRSATRRGRRRWVSFSQTYKAVSHVSPPMHWVLSASWATRSFNRVRSAVRPRRA
jgi:hypothetical protein